MNETMRETMYYIQYLRNGRWEIYVGYFTENDARKALQECRASFSGKFQLVKVVTTILDGDGGE